MNQTYRFLVKVTIIWLLILPVWLLGITPYYGSLLTSAANPLFSMNVVSSDGLEYEYVHPCVKGSIAFAVHDRAEERSGRGSLRFTMDGERFQFSLTVWVALLFATPFGRDWRRKILYFGLGLAVVFLIQEVDLFLQTADEKLTYMETAEFLRQFLPASRYDRFLGFCGRYFLLIGYVAAPIAVWIAIGPQRLRTAAARDAQGARVLTKKVREHSRS